jgi:hypothetical protein
MGRLAEAVGGYIAERRANDGEWQATADEDEHYVYAVATMMVKN